MPPAVPVTMLPQWTLKTPYGQKHQHEYKGNVSNPVVLTTLPPRQYGDTEIAQSPLLNRTTKTPKIYRSQDISSEMPYRIIPCNSDLTNCAALTAGHTDVIEPLNAAWSSAIGNRHIPPDLPYYYFECEITPGTELRLGFAEFGVKFGSHGQIQTAFKSPQEDDLDDGYRELLPEKDVSMLKHFVGVLNKSGKIDLLRELSQNDQESAANDGYGESETYFDAHYVFPSVLKFRSSRDESFEDSSSDEEPSFEVSEPAMVPATESQDTDMPDGANLGEENLRVRSPGHDVEEHSGSDSSSLSETHMFDMDDDDDDVDNDDEDDEDGLAENSDDEVDQVTRMFDLESGDDGTRNQRGSHRAERTSRQLVSVFSESDVVYDRRPARAVNTVHFVPIRNNPRARVIIWDPTNSHVYDSVHDYPVPSVSSPQRIGIVMNRLQNTVHLTCNGTRLRNDLPMNLKTDGKEWFPIVLIKSGRAKVRFGDGLQVNDSFLFDMSTFIDQNRFESISSRDTTNASATNASATNTSASSTAPDALASSSSNADSDYFTVGLPANQQGSSPAVDAAVDEYLEYYGYTVSARGSYESTRAQHVRSCVELGQFAKIMDMFAEDLTPNTLFLICFHQFVALARHEKCQKSALALGRALNNLHLTTQQRSQLNSAAAILVTNEPRAPELAYWYSPEFRTDLIREVLNVRPQVPVPKLQAYIRDLQRSDQAEDLRAQERIAALRSLSEGVLYKW